MTDAEIDSSAINRRLDDLKRQHDARIIYACESGSRAWGFPSADSDYDVRFIYVHRPEWYLSIAERRDVIEPRIEDALDFGGWDIRKCFRLLRKCNCPLIEWLSSHIVYRQNEAAIMPIKQLIGPAFLPESACQHYLAMARGRTRAIFESNEARLKTYFYALRATLCARFVTEHLKAPPMLFEELLSHYLPTGELRKTIDDFIVSKREGTEGDLIPRIPVFDDFLTEQQAEVEAQIPKNPRKLNLDVFDDAFRRTIDIVWA